MKIAIPYENGQVFQHFGHSAQFKLYTCLLYTSDAADEYITV